MAGGQKGFLDFIGYSIGGGGAPPVGQKPRRTLLGVGRVILYALGAAGASTLLLSWVFWTQATGWLAFTTESACRAALEAAETMREIERLSLSSLAAINCREVDEAKAKELTGRDRG